MRFCIGHFSVFGFRLSDPIFPAVRTFPPTPFSSEEKRSAKVTKAVPHPAGRAQNGHRCRRRNPVNDCRFQIGLPRHRKAEASKFKGVSLRGPQRRFATVFEKTKPFSAKARKIGHYAAYFSKKNTLPLPFGSFCVTILNRERKRCEDADIKWITGPYRQ